MNNKKTDRKYFFFDIDNTIAVDMPRVVPQSTRFAIRKLQEKGHFVSIATGRMYSMTREFCNLFGINTLVTDGGNGVVIDGQAEIKPLDKDVMVKLMKKFDEHNIPWAVCISTDRVWTTKTEIFPKKLKNLISRNYMRTDIKPDLDLENEENIYKGFAYLTREEEAELDFLKDVPHTRYADDYIIIEQDDKSIGIKRLRDILGFDDSDIVVFGDNTNDIKMFKKEWTKIAMGNSVDELKALADYVTTDADKDGVYNACVHFGWIEEEK